jgi:hypothetical protein
MIDGLGDGEAPTEQEEEVPASQLLPLMQAAVVAISDWLHQREEVRDGQQPTTRVLTIGSYRQWQLAHSFFVHALIAEINKVGGGRNFYNWWILYANNLP